MARLPDSLGVLRLREFRLLFAGQAVSVFGDRMVAVALAFAVLELGGSASDVGLVLACAIAPMVGTVLVGGVVADRTSRRAVMVGADLARVASQGVMAALLVTGAAELWMLAVLGGVTGAATGFFNPASTGLLPEVVPAGRLQPANALRSSAVSASEIVGPLVAGLLVAVVGAGWAIAADAASFAVSAACLLRMRVPVRRESGDEPTSFARELREGWSAFRARRWVWTFVAYFAVANMFWGAWSALGPVVAERDLGGAAAWGTVLAFFGVGALAGSLLATGATPRRPLVFVACTEALFCVPLAFLAVSAGVVALAAAATVSGAGMMLGNTVWESTLQSHVPDRWLSRVASYDWFGSFAFYPLGLALWGPLAGVLGTATALWLAFGLFMAGALVLLALPDTRRMVSSQPVATRS